MNEQELDSQAAQEEKEQQHETLEPKRRGPFARAGCIVGLVVWFLIMLLPCVFITLATQGQITLPLGDAPGQQFRMWLVMEVGERGIGISNPSVQQVDENVICVQTNVTFIFWEGQADPTSYCECYELTNAETAWTPTTTETGVC